MKGITEAISLENLENIVQRTLQKPLFPTQVRVMQRCKKRPIDKIHFSLQNYEKLEMSLVFQSSRYIKVRYYMEIGNIISKINRFTDLRRGSVDIERVISLAEGPGKYQTKLKDIEEKLKDLKSEDRFIEGKAAEGGPVPYHEEKTSISRREAAAHLGMSFSTFEKLISRYGEERLGLQRIQEGQTIVYKSYEVSALKKRIIYSPTSKSRHMLYDSPVTPRETMMDKYGMDDTGYYHFRHVGILKSSEKTVKRTIEKGGKPQNYRQHVYSEKDKTNFHYRLIEKHIEDPGYIPKWCKNIEIVELSKRPTKWAVYDGSAHIKEQGKYYELRFLDQLNNTK